LLKILIVLFITVPLFEIYLLLQVGGVIGVMPTIGLILLTAFLGALLLRLQGLRTLAAIRSSLEREEIPAVSLLEGLILLVTGALLLTPGFFTDALGFALLVPSLRRHLAQRLLHHFTVRQSQREAQSVVIEGEFREVNSRDEKPRQRLDR